MATYAATKAYVLSFSEALHEEAKPHGVTVTCLCPGPVRTEFQQVAGVDERKLRVGWTTTEKVVGDALRAAARGKAIVVPGGLNQATALSNRFIPRFVTRRIAEPYSSKAKTSTTLVSLRAAVADATVLRSHARQTGESRRITE
jgi:short-subunit dehydrogenase